MQKNINDMDKKVKFLIFAVFLVYFVSLIPINATPVKAAVFEEGTNGDTYLEFLKDLNINVSFKALRDNDTFILFLYYIILFLVVFSIAEFLPFLKKEGWIHVVFSLVFTLICVIFIPAELIRTIALSYSAFGVAVTVIIPFIALAVISKQLYLQEQYFLSKFLWGLYAASMVIAWLTAPAATQLFSTILYWIAFGVACIMILAMGSIMGSLFKLRAKEATNRVKMTQLTDLEYELEHARRVRDSMKRGTPEWQVEDTKVRDLQDKIRTYK